MRLLTRTMAGLCLALLLGGCRLIAEDDAMHEMNPQGPDTARPCTTAQVELVIFSGQPNPNWCLTEAETAELAALLNRLPAVSGSPAPDRLGYNGFTVQLRSQGAAGSVLRVTPGMVAVQSESAVVYRQDPPRRVEQLLLDTGKAYMEQDVLDVVETEFDN